MHKRSVQIGAPTELDLNEVKGALSSQEFEASLESCKRLELENGLKTTTQLNGQNITIEYVGGVDFVMYQPYSSQTEDLWVLNLIVASKDATTDLNNICPKIAEYATVFKVARETLGVLTPDEAVELLIRTMDKLDQ